MTQEEKAKAYDAVIERAKKVLLDCTSEEQKVVDYITPELKESEDERIELLNYLYDVHDDDEERARWITWLEKQGEHANFRNKIQIGDKVTRNKDGVLVNLSQLNRVAKKDEKQGEQPKKHDVCDNCDQQGCCVSPCPMKLVEKQGEQKSSEDEDREYACQSSEHYTRRELMIYNLGIFDGKRMIEDAIKETEPAWSEEDESMLNDIMHNIHFAETHRNVTGSSAMEKEQVNWLKSLKYRVQPKQEWSEEDEDIKETIIGELELVKKSVGEINYNGYDKLIDWLRSLRPKKQWKPSDEQMNTLEHYMHTLICNKHKEILFGLYADLKKLMEE